MNSILIGDKLFNDKYLPVKYIQTRYPASKSKRIRRKFKKKYTVAVPILYVLDESKLNFDFGMRSEIRLVEPEVDGLRYLMMSMSI